MLKSSRETESPAAARGAGSCRDYSAHDAPSVCAIYNYYVQQATATFEETVVSAEEMTRRIVDVTARFPWLVWEQDERVLGYAYATVWKGRSAYRHSVESTIYVAPDARGKGIGSTLYQRLLDKLRHLGIRCAAGIIALPNPASVALHEKLGFTKIGQLNQIGFKFDRWIDVGYWQIVLP